MKTKEEILQAIELLGKEAHAICNNPLFEKSPALINKIDTKIRALAWACDLVPNDEIDYGEECFFVMDENEFYSRIDIVDNLGKRG